MLRSIHFKNFVRYKEHQMMDFSNSGPFIFIGENGSGKSSVFEGIRRCLKLDYSTSVSSVPDLDNLSYFICNFETNPSVDKINTICGIVSIPATDQWMNDRTEDKIREQTLETKQMEEETVSGCQTNGSKQGSSNDDVKKDSQSDGRKNQMRYYKFVMNCSGNDPMFINLIEKSENGDGLNVSKSYKINSSDFQSKRDHFIDTIVKQKQEGDMHIDPYMQQVFESINYRSDETENKLESILKSVSQNVVFTFPLRSIGPLQWSESERINKKCRTKNYEEAEERCEIIKYFLKNGEKFNLKKEQKYYEQLTQLTQHKYYKFDLNDRGEIQLANGEFALLKTPEGILEAKAFSILISNKQYKTLILEEPERGMHPQLVERMIQIIKQEETDKRVILTTHHKGFITPWTVPSTFIFKRCDAESRIITCRSFFTGENKANMKKMRLLSSHHVPDIFFARKVLFYEGDSEDLFLREMKSQILAGKSKIALKLFANDNEEEAIDRLNKSLLQYTFIKMNGKGNLDFYQDVSGYLELDRLFLVDQDALKDILTKGMRKEERNKEIELAKTRSREEWESKRPEILKDHRVFFWLGGKIEDMVKEICDYDTATIREIIGKKVDDKLFLHEGITSEIIENKVGRLLGLCKHEDDLAQFIKILSQ